jgi:hypothetical protein
MIASPRIMVYVICRLVEIDNAGFGSIVADWWVDCTVNGSSDIAAIKVAHDSAGNNTKTSVSQYHVYYADGGHVRYKERAYLLEEASTARDPSLRVDPLVPTPELLPA